MVLPSNLIFFLKIVLLHFWETQFCNSQRPMIVHLETNWLTVLLKLEERLTEFKGCVTWGVFVWLERMLPNCRRSLMIRHNAIKKFAKEKKRWSLNKLTSIWGFLLVPLKKRLLAKIFSRWYLSVALAFPGWKEEKRRKAEKRKGKKEKAPLLTFSTAGICL